MFGDALQPGCSTFCLCCARVKHDPAAIGSRLAEPRIAACRPFSSSERASPSLPRCARRRIPAGALSQSTAIRPRSASRLPMLRRPPTSTTWSKSSRSAGVTPSTPSSRSRATAPSRSPPPSPSGSTSPGSASRPRCRMTDKAAMRIHLRAHGVPQPEFAVVSEPEAASRELEDIGLPAVLKPVDSGGQRGVCVIATPATWPSSSRRRSLTRRAAARSSSGTSRVPS